MTRTPPNAPFGTRLRAAMAERGPLCPGIDPHSSLLAAWGLPDTAAGCETFAMTAVEALAPFVSSIKPQSAFFERHGSRGVAVLEKVIAATREAGCLVILDVKRGDIGTTAQAYADAYLDPSSPLASDAITASPYLGFGSLTPMIETARRHNAGVFALALTSNPEAPRFQHARTVDGSTIAGEVLAGLRAANADAVDLGSFGAVVGATIGSTGEDLDISGPLLVPGIGAQGGTPDDVRRIFGSAVRNVVPTSTREILGAGPSLQGLRDAAARANDEFAALW